MVPLRFLVPWGAYAPGDEVEMLNRDLAVELVRDGVAASEEIKAAAGAPAPPGEPAPAAKAKAPARGRK